MGKAPANDRHQADNQGRDTQGLAGVPAPGAEDGGRLGVGALPGQTFWLVSLVSGKRLRLTARGEESMKTLNIYKAQGAGDTVPEDLTLIFDKEIPRPDIINSWESAWRDLLMEEAFQLADALCNVLPGGVVDALLVELLDRKRSMFIIPSFSKE